MEVNLREAVDQDAPTLLEVRQAAFIQYLGRLDPPSGVHRETADLVRKKLKTGKAVIASVGGEVAGCVFYRAEGAHIYLGRLSVLLDYRRQGIGSSLINYVEEFARRCQVPRVQLRVRLALPQLLAYYEGKGHQPVESRSHEGYAEPTYVLMEKNLY